jgi:Flp pilus assembly protein CpaB
VTGTTFYYFACRYRKLHIALIIFYMVLVVCIICAGLVAYYLRLSQKNNQPKIVVSTQTIPHIPLVSIPVLSHPIQAGARLNESDFTDIRWPEERIPEKCILTTSDLIGKYAKEHLEDGELVFEYQITDTKPGTSDEEPAPSAPAGDKTDT